jgi:hypothetical protein
MQTAKPKGQEHLPLVEPSDHPLTFAKHIFICGLHRSGTTLLENHMRSQFLLTALSAPVPENEGQHLQDVYPAAIEYGGPGRFAFSPEMRMTAEAEGTDRARLRLLECWSSWATEQTDTLLEKSPPNLTKIAWLRKVFPGAKFIVMTRDPRVAAAATIKWAKTSIEELIFHWQVAHEAALEDEADDCLRLRYEDYCENPERHLAMIGARFGLEPSSDAATKDDRFKDTRNSNSKYLADCTPRNFGTGIWREFGYAI